MSSQDRIKAEIQQNKQLVAEIDDKMEIIYQELKRDDLSEEDKTSLQEELDSLNYQFIELSADIAMLQELLDIESYQESDNEESYEPLEEVLTMGDY
jgi:hypothetical protein